MPQPRFRRHRAGFCAGLCIVGSLLLHNPASTATWAVGKSDCPVPTGLPRRTLALGLAVVTGAVGGAESRPVHAFENRVERLKSEPKFRGTPPGDLGAYPRKEGALPDLKGCKKSPNCFSSAAMSEDNPVRQSPEVEQAHYLEPWRFSKKSSAKAFEELESAVRAYKPGQRGIDGGGFDVKEADATRGYLYAVFESLRKGYQDDFELLVRGDPKGDGGEVRIRSASRQGKKDLGVNAKRLNGIIENLLVFEGWSAPKVTNDRFPEYVRLNSETDPEMNPMKSTSLFGMLKSSGVAK